MKRDMNKYMLAVLPAVLLLAAGCARELPDASDSSVLTARIADDPLETRASYDNTYGKFEWTAGDQIVVPYEDGRRETFDIVVNSTDPSKATLISSTRGFEFRTFYAVFPASVWVEPASGASAPTVYLKNSYDEYAAIIAGTSSLTQDYAIVPMVAKNDPSSNVLDFLHVGGLLRINCTGMDPTTKTIVVTFDQDVTGNYLVDVTDATNPFISTHGTNANKQVTFTVATSSAGVGSGHTDFYLNIPLPCGTYPYVKVEAFDASNNSLLVKEYTDYDIIVDRHHGKRISFTELEWNYHLDGTFSDVETDYTGGQAMVTVDMESYKEDAGGNKIPVAFEIQYSEVDAPYNWTTTKPDWVLMGGGIDYNGSTTGQTIKISMSPQANVVPLNDFGIPVDKHMLKLRSNTPVTSDLSFYNVATGTELPAWKRTTANCYVVQAPGTYTFPLVYGNGISKGGTNEPAYHAVDANGNYRNTDVAYLSTTGWRIGYFKDHLGDNITTPYIAAQLAAKSPSLSIQGANLLWTDAKGLIESVSYNDNGTDASYSDDYISFTITQQGIAQGNAVIAVYDSNGAIAWSWHIWVTDADLTQTEAVPSGTQISTLNLGWCDRRNTEEYPARHCYIRIVQKELGGSASAPILVQMDEGPTIYTNGNSPFYTYGRKDPMPGSDGTVGLPADKPCYTITGAPFNHVYANPAAGNISLAIQHPDVQYINEGHASWDSPSYWGLWNSTVDVNANVVTKTIYDPSPVGYKLPHFNAYLGLGLSNLTWVDNYSRTMVDAEGNPYSQDMGPGRKYNDLFFPATGSRAMALTDIETTGIFITADCFWYVDGFHNSYFRYTPYAFTQTSGASFTCESVHCTLDPLTP